MTDRDWYDAPVWTDDCQGKKDYDGSLVRVTSRYWPGNYRKDGKLSAVSTIVFCGIDMTEQQFTGETEAEVKRAVITWVGEQIAVIRAGLDMAFRTVPAAELTRKPRRKR